MLTAMVLSCNARCENSPAVVATYVLVLLPHQALTSQEIFLSPQDYTDLDENENPNWCLIKVLPGILYFT